MVSPSPHDVHHAHEAVGRGVQRAMAALPPTVRWWMWGVWGDLPAPNVYYGYDAAVLDRALHILDAYAGELERNDYRPFLSGRAAANAVMGSERVFGFGSPAASTRPYADLVTEVRLVDGRFMASEPHHLDQGPEPAASYARRPDAVARLADRPRDGGLHPRGPGRAGAVNGSALVSVVPCR